MITKNILYKYFKDFADNHLQIKDYGYGDLWEISSSQATTYPLFWVSPQPSNISGNEISYNFNILIGDRLEDGDANKVEVESDTFQIGLDLLATLNLDRELDLDKNNTLTPFIHDFKDRIAGHLITISVSAPFDYNECAVPTTGTPQPPASSCPSAFITINGIDYGSVISGGTEDILVVDGSGNQVGSLVSGNWVVTSSCPNATAVLKNTAGTTISTTSIASGASSNITAPDASAVLKDSAGTTISTTAILSGGSSNITAPDGSAVLKNTLNTTLSTTSILSNGSSNITAPDSTITINSASFSPYPSGATSNILVKDGTGTQVGSKVGSEWIVPTAGGSFDVGLIDRFGNTFPTKSVTANATWDLRTLTPQNYADIYLSRLTNPPTGSQLTAVYTYFTDMVSAGLFQGSQKIDLCIGGNSADHSWNARYPFDNNSSMRSEFIGSPTHDSNGVSLNGTTQAVRTNAYLRYLEDYNKQISIYTRNNIINGVTGSIIFNAGSPFTAQGFGILQDSRNRYSTEGISIAPNLTSALGLTSLSRESSTTIRYRQNATNLTSSPFTSTAVYNKVGDEVTIGAFMSQALAFSLFKQVNYCYFRIGNALSDAQETTHYSIVQALQTALGRQV